MRNCAVSQLILEFMFEIELSSVCFPLDVLLTLRVTFSFHIWQVQSAKVSKQESSRCQSMTEFPALEDVNWVKVVLPGSILNYPFFVFLFER